MKNQNKSYAVIFDLEGVISDTQIIHSSVEADLLMSFDILINPEELSKRFSGISDEVMFKSIFEEVARTNVNITEVLKRKELLMDKAIAGSVKVIAGASLLIKQNV